MGSRLFKSGLAVLISAVLVTRLWTGFWLWAAPGDTVSDTAKGMVFLVATVLMLAGVFWTRTQDLSGQLEASDPAHKH